MTGLVDTVGRDLFEPLPQPRSNAGSTRRVGIEIEFAGLTESRVAEIVAATLGGNVVEVAPYEMAVEDTSIGRVRSFLDTAFRSGRQHALSRLGLELGREVIPVEVVTEPLEPAALPRVEALRAALHEAGALGSREALLLSFGVHLNVEVAGDAVDAWRPVLTAFALLEDWLRLADPIDGARRLLPFVDPYPPAFVADLVALAPDATAADIVDLYLRLTPTRNRALDMLPLFAHLDADRLDRAPGDLGKVSARPAYHYRMPDSRIDEANWRLAYEWNRWVMVERVAADADLLAAIAARWCERGQLRRDWCAELEDVLRDAGIVGAAA